MFLARPQQREQLEERVCQPSDPSAATLRMQLPECSQHVSRSEQRRSPGFPFHQHLPPLDLRYAVPAGISSLS